MSERWVPGLNGRSARVHVEEWYGDGEALPVVAIESVGRQGGVYGRTWLLPGMAELLATRLQEVAAVARSRTDQAHAARVAGQLGYPAEFGA